MQINCDQKFINELNKNGYDISYEKIIQIYHDSRKKESYLEKVLQQAEDEKKMMDQRNTKSFFK